jgi:elongation factor G
VGQVDEGTATLDFEAMERERGITIHSAAIDLPWKDRRISL